jgi:hypothetical protein
LLQVGAHLAAAILAAEEGGRRLLRVPCLLGLFRLRRTAGGAKPLAGLNRTPAGTARHALRRGRISINHRHRRIFGGNNVGIHNFL